MNTRRLALLGAWVNTFIFSFYYLVVKDTLDRWDPLLFLALSAVAALPVGLVLLLLFRHGLARHTLLWGLLVGALLSIGFAAMTIALRFTDVMEVAYVPCLNGVLAALVQRFLGQSVKRRTWAMAALSVSGMILLMSGPPLALSAHWRGDLSALLGAILYSITIFLLEAILPQHPTGPRLLALSGSICLGLSLSSVILVIFFGGSLHLPVIQPADLGAILFMGLCVMALTTIIGTLSQHQMQASSLVFLHILEPIIADLGSVVFLHDTYAPLSYAGAALGIVAVLGQGDLLPHWREWWKRRRRTRPACPPRPVRPTPAPSRTSQPVSVPRGYGSETVFVPTIAAREPSSAARASLSSRYGLPERRSHLACAGRTIPPPYRAGIGFAGVPSLLVVEPPRQDVEVRQDQVGTGPAAGRFTPAAASKLASPSAQRDAPVHGTLDWPDPRLRQFKGLPHGPQRPQKPRMSGSSFLLR